MVETVNPGRSSIQPDKDGGLDWLSSVDSDKRDNEAKDV
jgi:hypothetical protein